MKKRHVLVKLREILGLKQTAFAALIGVSPSTIQSIELDNGRLKLSTALAEKVSIQTGVEIGWLLKNDWSMIPKNRFGAKYKKDDFEIAQSNLLNPILGFHETNKVARERLKEHFKRIILLMVATHSNDKWAFFDYKLNKTLSEMETEFAHYKLRFGESSEGMDILEVDGKENMYSKGLKEVLENEANSLSSLFDYGFALMLNRTSWENHKRALTDKNHPLRKLAKEYYKKYQK